MYKKVYRIINIHRLLNRGEIMNDGFLIREGDQLKRYYDILRQRFAEYIVDKEFLQIHLYNLYYKLYVAKIGVYEYELFSLDLEIMNIKSQIIFLYDLVEAELPINLTEVENRVHKELEEYYHILEDHKKDIYQAKSGSWVDGINLEEFTEINKEFRNLVLLISPQLKNYRNDIIITLWQKGCYAYKNNELSYLKIIIKLAQDELGSIGRGPIDEMNLEEAIKHLEESIKNIQDEIIAIKEEFPYYWVDILMDGKNTRRVQNELKIEIKELSEILTMFQEHFMLLLGDKLFLN